MIGFTGHLFAQVNTRKITPFPTSFSTKWNAVGLRFQAQDFYVSESPIEDTCNCLPQSLQSRGNTGLLLSFYRSTGTRLSYSANLGFSSGRVGTKPVPTIKSLKDNFTSFRGDLYYHIGPDKQPVSPYLHTGLHAQFGDFYASLPTGAGFRFLSRNYPTMITTEVNYGWGLTNQLRNSLIFSVGVYMRLNAGKKTAASPVSSPALPAADASCMDSDFDGVPDGADKCPRLAGSPLNAGCPVCDTDGDGVTDDKDKCPTVPGSIKQEGCPVPDTVYITRETAILEKTPVVKPLVQEKEIVAAPAYMPVIHFSPMGTGLDSNGTTLVAQTAAVIRNNPASRYTIYGYSGPTKWEKQKSSEQVSTVANYLIEKEGINPDRLVLRSGLQGGTSNTVKVRKAVEGEEQDPTTSPTKDKITY